MTLRPSTLFGRNLLALVAMLVASLCIAGALMVFLVLLPQTQRVAGVTAAMLSSMSQAMRGLGDGERDAVIAHLAKNQTFTIVRADRAPPLGDRWPSLLERLFMYELSTELGGRELLWRTDRRRTLWVLTDLGDEPYWVKVNAPVTLQPLTAVILSLCASFALALFGGVLLQRRIARPLETLATSAAAIGPHGGAERLDETGPLEVASVARAFNAMNARLADAEADRRFVLAAVSHDMRTPLARLRLAIALLAGRDPELEMNAVRQIDEIDRAVGQFIDFARGFEAEAPAPCDVVAIARACAADAPGVAIEAPDELIAEVRAEALRRALVNLLENAARHGAPPVTVRVLEEGAAIRIEVRDGGAGVPPAQWDSIRAPFVRAEGTRGAGGVGLGLSIVERIARVHRGRLDLDAPANGGFSASLTFPKGPHLLAP